MPLCPRGRLACCPDSAFAGLPCENAQEMLQEVRFTFEHVCARGDRVAVLRDTSVTLKDGTHQPGIAVFDVWRVQGGQVGGCSVLLLPPACGSPVHRHACASLRQRCCHPPHPAPPHPVPCAAASLAPAQIVSGEQCWQRLLGPAGDDIPHTPREGELAELVHKALAGLQNLAAVQVRLLWQVPTSCYTASHVRLY